MSTKLKTLSEYILELQKLEEDGYGNLYIFTEWSDGGCSGFQPIDEALICNTRNHPETRYYGITEDKILVVSA
jgi:hypothetical protein